MANSMVTRIRGGITGAQGKITRVRGVCTSLAQGAVTKVRGRVIGANVINPGQPQSVNPFDLVTLNAFSPSGSNPDSWAWTVVSGGVLLDPGSGPTRTYKAPATMSGVSAVFQVTATTAGFPDVSGTVTHTVSPHAGFWEYRGSLLTGVEIHDSRVIPV